MEFNRTIFFTGFMVGFLVAGVAGYLLGRINVARNAMRSPDRPMAVPTRGTPREVMATAAAAFRQCLFWTIMFGLFSIVAIAVLYWILFA